MKKVIIAGGRDLPNNPQQEEEVTDWINAALDKFPPDTVLCGDAPGIDTLGARLASAKSIPVAHFPADWNKLGKAAGPIRNKQMVDIADELWVIWDGQSPGSKNVIDLALQKGIRVLELVV